MHIRERAQLVYREENGKDLREYHVGRYYQIPAGVEYKINSFLRQPERASTPMPEETAAEENLPKVQSIISGSSSVAVKETSKPAVAAVGQVDVKVKVKVEPALEQEPVPMISYGDQSTFSVA